jgi:hypothetical protein
MSKNNASFYDPKTLIQMGINPKTGLPIKFEEGVTCITKGDIKKQLRIVDEQDAVNRFTWYNLPEGINARLIERILYYKGQGMLFFLKDKFYFLPFALDGTIDVYGRFTSVTPLPFNGTTSDGKDKPWIQGLSFKPVYDVQLPEDYMDKSYEEVLDVLESSCVILKDYTEQISQTNISRQILNDPILDLMSECFPFMRTSLLNSTGVTGMRVYSENESANVYAANNAITKAALEGKSKVPIVGKTEFQDLTSGSAAKAEEFLLAMQSIDNYRLSLYGLDNGGLFQKKSHILQAEQEMNTGNVGLVMRDSLQYRQDFCTICNSIWNLDMWCEPSEVVLGIDTTGDGVLGDNESGQKEAMQEEMTSDM